METLQLIYIAMCFAGGVFLLISIFGGDLDSDFDLDLGDGDFDAATDSESVSVFSFRTIATFLLGAGIGGWSAFGAGAVIGWQIFWAFFAGLVIAALYFLVMKGLYSLQGSSTPSASELIGKEGVITIPTTSTGVAQVRIATKNGNVEYTCKEVNKKDLKQNDTVKITSSSMGIGTLSVEKV